AVRAVAVGLVHDEDEVIQRREVFEVALADVLEEPLDPRYLAASHLGVDLRDVENVHVDTGLTEETLPADATAGLVVVAGDDLRRLARELGEALQDVLRHVRREVAD